MEVVWQLGVGWARVKGQDQVLLYLYINVSALKKKILFFYSKFFLFNFFLNCNLTYGTSPPGTSQRQVTLARVASPKGGYIATLALGSLIPSVATSLWIMRVAESKSILFLLVKF